MKAFQHYTLLKISKILQLAKNGFLHNEAVNLKNPTPTFS